MRARSIYLRAAILIGPLVGNITARGLAFRPVSAMGNCQVLLPETTQHCAVCELSQPTVRSQEVHQRKHRTLVTQSAPEMLGKLAFQSIPSWNQIITWLKEMETLRTANI
jgi:hypothetical protein